MSGDNTVREVWGLIKQLRMSEANLKRRVEELEANFDSKSLGIRLSELKTKYESRISCMQKEFDIMTERIAKEIQTVVIQANDEISALRVKVNEQDKIIGKSTMIKIDSLKWMDSMTLCGSLLAGSINKWFACANIKFVFSEILTSICRSQLTLSSSLKSKTKLRSCIYVIIFFVRLSRILGTKQDKLNKDALLCREKHKCNPGAKYFFQKLVVASSHYNSEVSCLINAISHSESPDNEEIEEAFINHLDSAMQRSLHPTRPFSINFAGPSREEEMRNRVKEAGDLLEQSMKIIEEKEREILFLREGGFNLEANGSFGGNMTQ